LEAVRKGEAKPTNAAECIQLAKLAAIMNQRLLASRLFDNAFFDNNDLANDLNSWNRYNAACSAALAAGGLGINADKLDDKERLRLRKQALDWLRADLDLWTKHIAGAKPQDRQPWTTPLKHWQEDTDLIGVRDAKELEKLPADEREGYQKLWAEVAELLKKTSEAK
jgi:hypothetical protein